MAFGFEDLTKGLLFHSALLISYSRHILNLEWSCHLLASLCSGPIGNEVACKAYTDENPIEVFLERFETSFM